MTHLAIAAAYLLASAVAVYSFWLPGPRQWCWDAATGPVAGYEVEAHNDNLSLLLGFDDPGTCITLDHSVPGRWTVRVRAFDVAGNYGPWSEPAIYPVRAAMDADGDGLVGIRDFQIFREVFGLCVDGVGYGECE